MLCCVVVYFLMPFGAPWGALGPPLEAPLGILWVLFKLSIHSSHDIRDKTHNVLPHMEGECIVNMHLDQKTTSQ